MSSRYRYANEDPLGFTKQTASMLVGLGAEDLVPQFRKRNISLQGLTALSKQDLIALGASESLADEILRKLSPAARKFKGRDLSEELRTRHLSKILSGANCQLNFIQIYLCYARLRLAKESQDFIIDANKNTRASQALCSAATCLITDLENLEKNLKELILEFPECKPGAKTPRLITFCMGLGVAAGILLTLRYVLAERTS